MSNRLQKKAFIASAGVHSLLVVILLVGPAFLTPKDKPEDAEPLKFIPWKTVDAMVSGGGNPNARPPAAVIKPPEAERPTPIPPAPPQREPEKAKEPEPIKDSVHEPKKEKADAESFELSKKPKLPNVSTTVVKPRDNRKTIKRPATNDAQDAQERQVADARRRAVEAINRTAGSLRDDVSSTTTVDTNYGPGGGGEAYANYGQVVRAIYEQMWTLPEGVDRDEAITKVKVTIASDGTVTASQIIRGSGDATVDRSVQRTLERVRFVRPFPEGSKDKERTYTINFSLKAKRMLG